MKKLTRYSIGATLVAAALTLPQGVFAQIRSNPLAYGAGTSQAQRVDRRAPIQSGVYIAPGVGVREVATPVDAYERSSWTQATTENVADAELSAAGMEKLQRDYDANQERAKKRKTTRPINVPTTLGMLKDKPAGQRANVAAQNAVQPQYLQYGPNTAPAQSAPNAYVNASAIGGAATLNWDGSTNRGAQYGRVQSSTHAAARPATLDPIVLTTDQAQETGQAPTVVDTPVVNTPVADAPQSLSVTPFPELPDDAESSNFANDVVSELQNGVSLPDDAPTIDDSDASLDSNAATFVAPSLNETNVEPPAEIVADPASNDVPDFNAAETLQPVPNATAVPETTSEVAPQPAPTAPTAPQAAPNAQAVPAVPEPVYRKSYPQPKNVTPYAPKQDYLLMQPYYAPQAQARPRAVGVPQTRGIPTQFAYPGQPGCAPQATCQVDQAPSCGTSCGTYGGYDSGMNLAYAATAGAQPGLIFGAEWFNWSTQTGITSGTIFKPDGSVYRRDLDVENSGLRGRFGFRSLAGWDLVGTFTLFNQSANDGLGAGQLQPGAAIVDPATGQSVVIDSVSTTLKVDLQSIDIELGRWKQVGLWDFRLFGGVRWTGLDQTLTDAVTYTDTSSDALDAEIALLDSSALFDEDGATEFSAAVADPASKETGFLTRSRMNAFGVRLGLETRIPLYGGLAIYGKGAGAIAAGRVKSTFGGLNVGELGTYKKTELSPSVDASLGLSWRVNGLEARAGYEFNGWYNSGYVDGKKTDFLAHGVVAGLGYNY